MPYRSIHRQGKVPATHSEVPLSYSHASARIVLDASGVYTPSGLVTGTVVANATNGALRSVGIYSPTTRKVITRLKPSDVKGDLLSFGTRRDRATLDAFTR